MLGKTYTQKLTIDPTSAKNVKFNCDNLVGNSNNATYLQYQLLDESTVSTYGSPLVIAQGYPNYSPSGNPFKMSVSCNDTTATFTYTIPSTVFTNGEDVTSVGKYLSFTNITDALTVTDGSSAISDPTAISNVITDSDGKTISSNMIIGGNIYSNGSGYANSPLTINDTSTTKYNTPVNVNVLANDKARTSTFDGVKLDPTTVKLIDASGNLVDTLTNSDGTYKVNSDGTVGFTPAAGFSGVTKPVSYQVTDTNGTPSDPATITITVGEAAKGTVTPDTANTNFGSPVKITPLDNDKAGDASFDTSTLTVTPSDSSQGTWATDNGVTTFTPASGFTGDANATYTVKDAAGNTYSSTITVTVGKASAPTAKDITDKTEFNTPVTTDLTPSVSTTQPGATVTKITLLDGDGNPVTSIKNNDGTYTLDGSNITFTPADGYHGTTTPVAYQVTDSNGNTAKGTYDVTVGDATAPTANPVSNSTAFNTPVTTDLTPSVSTTQPGATVTKITLLDGDGNPVTSIKNDDGTYTLDGNKVVFTPADGYHGTTTPVAYQVTDSNGKTSNSTITIIVADANSPAAADDVANTAFNTPANVKVLDNDTLGQVGSTWSKVSFMDADGNSVSTLTNSDGTYTVAADNSVNFTPAPGFHGMTTPVTYMATDSNGKDAHAKVSFNVADATAPTVNSDSNETAYGQKVTTPVLDNDVLGEKGSSWAKVQLKDADGKLVDTVTNSTGTYTVTTDNQIEFTPATGYTGASTITYVATDSNGKTGESTLTVTVDEKPKSTPTTTPTSPSSTPTSPSSTSTPTSTSKNPTTEPTGTPTSSSTSTSTTPSSPSTTISTTVTDTPTSTQTDTPVTAPTQTPSKVVKPVVGPTVQTDYVSGSGSATDIAGIAALASLLGGGIGAAKLRRSKK